MTACPLGSPRWRLFAFHVKQISAPLLGVLLTLSLVDVQDTATVGEWSPVLTWPYEAIHEHVLPTGQFMFWTRRDRSEVWHTARRHVRRTASDGADIYCYGAAF